MRTERVNGHTFYLVDDTIQSVYPPATGGYWPMFLPNHKVKKALILGLGAGTVAQLLLNKYKGVEIWGVDVSEEMLDRALANLPMDSIKVYHDDAFDFVKECKEKFDYICVDLYDGYWFPVRALQSGFINHIKRLLIPGGEAIFNLPDIEKLIAENIGPSTRKGHQASLILTLKGDMIASVKK